jgi:hypothetical protein
MTDTTSYVEDRMKEGLDTRRHWPKRGDDLNQKASGEATSQLLLEPPNAGKASPLSAGRN